MTTQPDDLSQYYAELLEGIYDCVDRIVLNAFFPMGQTGGGMRSWWRSLHGDDSQLDDKHLREMAGTFSRRLHAFCAKQGIPIVEAQSGERKHELAEPHVPKDPTFRGLFLVITGNAPAPIWEVERNAAGQITEIRHRKNWPFIKHYYFHIMDREWGHVTIRMCGYPSFGAQLILNGHEWVEREARRKCLTAVKDGNCFVEGSDFDAVNRLAAKLQRPETIGRLRELCERWIYSTCLFHAARRLHLSAAGRSRAAARRPFCQSLFLTQCRLRSGKTEGQEARPPRQGVASLQGRSVRRPGHVCLPHPARQGHQTAACRGCASLRSSAKEPKPGRSALRPAPRGTQPNL